MARGSTLVEPTAASWSARQRIAAVARAGASRGHAGSTWYLASAGHRRGEFERMVITP
jgi:hypothetical protein